MPPELTTAIISFAVIFITAMGTLITAIVVMIKRLSENSTQSQRLDLEAREWFQNQVTSVTDENKRISAELGNLKEELTSQKYELASAKGNTEALQKQIKAQDETIANLKEELRHYQTENGQLISSNAKLSRDNETYKTQKERAEELNKQYLRQITEQSDKITTLEAQVRDLDMRLRHYESLLTEQLKSKEDTQKIPPLKEDNELKTPIIEINDNDDKEDIPA